MTLEKKCSLTRQRLLLHSFSSSASSSSSSPSSSFRLFVVFSLSLIFCTLPSYVVAFKAGHVEPVPGNSVPRGSRPLISGTANNSNRNSNNNNNQFPPTGGGSRSAILTKLTSPRREFGAHVYQEPGSSLESPIASDLYAFSKSQESSQNQNEQGERPPFVRFPTISSPFSNIVSGGSSRATQSRESHKLRHAQPAQQQQKKKETQKASSVNNKVRQQQQQGHVQQTPFAQSVSDLLAQREEPSSLFGSSGAGIAEQDEDADDLLFDSYYTSGSDGDVLLSSQVDNDRYGSEENSLAATARDDDLFEKQSATPPSSVDASSSSSSNSSRSSSSGRSRSNNASSKTKSRSSNENASYRDDGEAQDDAGSNNDENVSLSKPTLLPLPANYLSLATFRQIDNTLEKSSSNILSRIANFWRNRTMSSHHQAGGGDNSSLGSNSSTLSTTNSSSSILLTQLSSSGGNDSKQKQREADHANASTNDNDAHTDNDNAFLNNLDDVINRSSSSSSNGRYNRSRAKSENKSSSISDNKSVRQSESDNVAAQPTKYISIEDLDGVSIGDGGVGGTANSNQYLSLDDEDEGDLGVSGEDFAVSTGGGNTKEAADEHSAGVTKSSSSSKQKDEHLDDQPDPQHDHHSMSVEDYITGETTSSSSSGAVGLEEWLGGESVGVGDSAQSSHTFHDDLFHTTTGTITAVIDNSSGSKNHHKKDLMSSGSSKIERVQKSESERKRASSSTSVAGGSPTKGDVKRAESDKIWSSIDSHFGRHDLIESAESEEEHDYYYGMTIGGFLKRELWTIPLFVLASLNMILIILFEVYVLCRARGTSRRHLFLGQMLLFGLFLCSFLALMFAVHPSIIGCFVGRLGVGITYSLIFSVLMVKCVFLLSLDTGVYLPTSYQGILLFFAVAVQVAIDTQWVIMYPPFLQTVESGRSILLQCGTSFVQLLYSLSYVGVLVLIVGLLAGRAAYKGVVENYREAVYILITAVVTVPVALSWTVAGWMLQGRHQDACVSFGLVAHSLTTFLIMFMPKGRQLASLDKEAVCFEDQEDQCSGYSPSFFHFKPTTKNYKTALWGDGNLYTTLEPTVSTINPNVFFHRNDFHSGMIY